MAQRGVDHADCRLTPDDIRSIRDSPRTCRQLGAAYGCSAMNISKIKRRITWDHVT